MKLLLFALVAVIPIAVQAEGIAREHLLVGPGAQVLWQGGSTYTGTPMWVYGTFLLALTCIALAMIVRSMQRTEASDYRIIEDIIEGDNLEHN